MSANNALDANIVAVMGSTGCGKSTMVKAVFLKKSDRRRVIWDYKREYGADYGDLITESLEEVIQALKNPTFRIVFRPSFDDSLRVKQFDLFCKALWHAGNLKVLIEELGLVTTAQRAPAGWKQLSCTGRSQGVYIIATSQRPGQVDKDFWDNVSEIFCFTLGPKGRLVLAAELDVTEDDIKALETHQYLHKNNKTKKIILGKNRSPAMA